MLRKAGVDIGEIGVYEVNEAPGSTCSAVRSRSATRTANATLVELVA